MFGIEFYEILVFLRQAGLAVAGAASFWSFGPYLIINKNSSYFEFMNTVSRRLLFLFFPAAFLFIMAWSALGVILCILCADAHEGITRFMGLTEIIHAMQGQYSVIVFFALLWTGGLLLFTFKKDILFKNLQRFHGVSFVVVSFLMIFPLPATESARAILSSVLHSWHSILTLGSVIVVDFLFRALRKDSILLLARLFSWITKGIWLGLGLDFMSSALILNDGYSLTDRFLFNQTIIGILIINGAILAGPIFRKLSVAGEGREEKLGWNIYTIAGASGAISLGSWLTIIAIDGFKTLSLAYFELSMSYIVLIMLIFVLYEVFERILGSNLSRRSNN